MTAPPMLSSPPITTAGNASSPSALNARVTLPCWLARTMPPMNASTVPMPQARSETRWTLTPDRIAASLCAAAARICRPMRVNLKKSAKASTHPAAIAIVITSSDEMTTPDTSQTLSGNCVGYGRSITPQPHGLTGITEMITSDDADRRHRHRQERLPDQRPGEDELEGPADRDRAQDRERDRDPRVPAEGDGERDAHVGAEHHQVALREVEHLRRLVDEREPERDEPVDRPVGDPDDEELDELGHGVRMTAQTRRRRRSAAAGTSRCARESNECLVEGQWHVI